MQYMDQLKSFLAATNQGVKEQKIIQDLEKQYIGNVRKKYLEKLYDAVELTGYELEQ